MDIDLINSNHIMNLVDWKNPPSVEDLRNDLKEAQGDHNEHVTNVNKWLDTIKGTIDFKVREGRSKVVPKVVRKQAEWLYASLESPFLSSPNIFDVAPVTHLDDEAARQNALVLNKQFRVDINRVKFINKYVRTAVNTGTVIVKLGWEEIRGDARVEVEVPVFAETPEEAMMFLQSQVQTQAMTQEEAQQLLMSGQPIQIGVDYEEQIQEQILVNRPVLQIKDSRDVIIDPTCEGDFDKARFVIDTFTTDLSSLKKDGRYKNLDLIPSSEFNKKIDDSMSTNTEINNTSFEFKDKARQKLIVNEYWGYWDIDDTGIVEPIVATFVGNTMIRLEKNPYPDKKLPYVVVTFLPTIDNSIYGEPLAELLSDNQNIIGAIQRGMIDIFGRSANGQRLVAKGLLDTVNKQRFNEDKDCEVNPIMNIKDGFTTTTFPEIPNSIFNAITFQSNEAEALSGVKAFSQGITSEALGSSVGGIRSALDATAKRELSILRRLSDGLISIGKKILSMNSVWLSDEEIIRITDDEFVTIKRDDLAGKFDLNVTISTAEEDSQKASELSFLLQTLGNTAPIEVTQILLSEIATLYKMPKLAKILKEFKPEPDPLVVQRQQLENQLLEAQIENEKAKARENAVDVELKSAKTQNELAKAGKLSSEKDAIDLKYVEDATGLTQERELEKTLFSKKDNNKKS